LIDDERPQACCQRAVGLADLGRGRTHAVHIGRNAGHVICQAAAAFGHHSDISKYERFDLARNLPVNIGNLGDGQNTRQSQHA
jgi:hypothetical protein